MSSEVKTFTEWKKRFDLYEGKYVPLEMPMVEEPELNKPKRSSGPSKYVVYVKDPKTGNVKKISFGAKGMTTGLRDKKRRNSFKNRHRCETHKNDKMKAGYWACRIGRYPAITGAPYTKWW